MTRERPLHERVEFAQNPEPRCPCVLLLDTSGSMAGERINALNAGLRSFHDALLADSVAAQRIDVAVITFDSRVDLAVDFTVASRFSPPVLAAAGQTHMGSGIARALDAVAERKTLYRENGVPYFRPWIFMITDGKPEGEPESIVRRATQRLREDEASKSVAFFAVGIGDADIERLKEITVRTPLELEGLEFDDMFNWLSASMQALSRSKPGEKVLLPKMSWLKRIALFIEDHQGAIKDGLTVVRVIAKTTFGV